MIKMVDEVVESGLAGLLHRHWGVRADRLQALPSGHTNKSFLVESGGRLAVLRVSWPGKTAKQVGHEAQALAHLRAVPGLPALPRARLTMHPHTGVVEHDGCWLHLFEHIAGESGSLRAPAGRMAPAMVELARLHQALSTLPSVASHPAHWLTQRYQRVCQRPAPVLPGSLHRDYRAVLRQAEQVLASAASWLPGPTRWIHGDYHAGNLLMCDDQVSGILDFDEVGQGSQCLETALALFALSRDDTVEQGLAFDADLWRQGLQAYAQSGCVDAERLMREQASLRRLFCVDQVLIHLEAAQRQLWRLGPGMGFFACWHDLLQAPPLGRA